MVFGEFATSGWESNPRLCKFSKTLSQLRDGVRCRENSQEFSLYMVVMTTSGRVYLKGHCGIYTRLTVRCKGILIQLIRCFKDQVNRYPEETTLDYEA